MRSEAFFTLYISLFWISSAHTLVDSGTTTIEPDDLPTTLSPDAAHVSEFVEVSASINNGTKDESSSSEEETTQESEGERITTEVVGVADPGEIESEKVTEESEPLGNAPSLDDSSSSSSSEERNYSNAVYKKKGKLLYEKHSRKSSEKMRKDKQSY